MYIVCIYLQWKRFRGNESAVDAKNAGAKDAVDVENAGDEDAVDADTEHRREKGPSKQVRSTAAISKRCNYMREGFEQLATAVDSFAQASGRAVFLYRCSV